jgi:hypothetical protein
MSRLAHEGTIGANRMRSKICISKFLICWNQPNQCLKIWQSPNYSKLFQIIILPFRGFSMGYEAKNWIRVSPNIRSADQWIVPKADQPFWGVKAISSRKSSNSAPILARMMLIFIGILSPKRASIRRPKRGPCQAWWSEPRLLRFVGLLAFGGQGKNLL